MYPHRIRLLGPWQFAQLPSDASQLPQRVSLPFRRTAGECGARPMRLSRRFGYPGRIDDFERVWLIAEGVEESADLCLNGNRLGCFHAKEPGYEEDVTSLLRPRNELTVDVTPASSGAYWGEVALEVRCLAFLRGVSVQSAGSALQISGTVVGPAEKSLELYAVVARRPADYAVVQSSPAGIPFRLTATVPAGESDGEPLTVKVELVNGASPWYTFEEELPRSAPNTPR